MFEKLRYNICNYQRDIIKNIILNIRFTTKIFPFKLHCCIWRSYFSYIFLLFFYIIFIQFIHIWLCIKCWKLYCYQIYIFLQVYTIYDMTIDVYQHRYAIYHKWCISTSICHIWQLIYINIDTPYMIIDLYQHRYAVYDNWSISTSIRLIW